eukprot:MONOS_4270.1-p1 / transcript=MONOS_4270.1 / gene=MONOS_4270 / organism=Monocercomonoides_exilis_PA203 / gene_product=unspecified product / transcript_product=unspecified product / location=Mono_scaffold00111:72473-74685(-) / protein_length=715 / sequence_SO=supercontig / SO=protein_coding / is_pseudo=false
MTPMVGAESVGISNSAMSSQHSPCDISPDCTHAMTTETVLQQDKLSTESTQFNTLQISQPIAIPPLSSVPTDIPTTVPLSNNDSSSFSESTTGSISSMQVPKSSDSHPSQHSLTSAANSHASLLDSGTTNSTITSSSSNLSNELINHVSTSNNISNNSSGSKNNIPASSIHPAPSLSKVSSVQSVHTPVPVVPFFEMSRLNFEFREDSMIITEKVKNEMTLPEEVREMLLQMNGAEGGNGDSDEREEDEIGIDATEERVEGIGEDELESDEEESDSEEEYDSNGRRKKNKKPTKGHEKAGNEGLMQEGKNDLDDQEQESSSFMKGRNQHSIIFSPNAASKPLPVLPSSSLSQLVQKNKQSSFMNSQAITPNRIASASMSVFPRFDSSNTGSSSATSPSPSPVPSVSHLGNRSKTQAVLSTMAISPSSPLFTILPRRGSAFSLHSGSASQLCKPPLNAGSEHTTHQRGLSSSISGSYSHLTTHNGSSQPNEQDNTNFMSVPREQFVIPSKRDESRKKSVLSPSTSSYGKSKQTPPLQRKPSSLSMSYSPLPVAPSPKAASSRAQFISPPSVFARQPSYFSQLSLQSTSSSSSTSPSSNSTGSSSSSSAISILSTSSNPTSPVLTASSPHSSHSSARCTPAVTESISTSLTLPTSIPPTASPSSSFIPNSLSSPPDSIPSTESTPTVPTIISSSNNTQHTPSNSHQQILITSSIHP